MDVEIGDWNSQKLSPGNIGLWSIFYNVNFSFKDEFAKHYGPVLPVEDAGVLFYE